MTPSDKKAPIKTGVPDHEDVNIILKLYEMRREPVMRQARDFVGFEWFPSTYEEFAKLFDLNNPKNAYFRQVATYWEMCATFVNMGALHEELFWNTTGEAVFFYSKVAPFLERARTEMMGPQFLSQLQALIQRRPDGAERVKMVQGRIAKIAEMKRSAK